MIEFANKKSIIRYRIFITINLTLRWLFNLMRQFRRIITKNYLDFYFKPLIMTLFSDDTSEVAFYKRHL